MQHNDFRSLCSVGCVLEKLVVVSQENKIFYSKWPLNFWPLIHWAAWVCDAINPSTEWVGKSGQVGLTPTRGNIHVPHWWGTKQRKNFGFSSGRNQIFLQIMNSVKKGKEGLKISRWSLFRRRVQQLIEKVKYQVDKGVFKQLPLCIQETWGGLTSGKGGGWKLKIKGKWALEPMEGFCHA